MTDPVPGVCCSGFRRGQSPINGVFPTREQVLEDLRLLADLGFRRLRMYEPNLHAETTLAARASQAYSREFLSHCTLYTTAEPCAMCAGAIYWANIGRVVYGMTERRLLQLTGSNEQNPTFDLPCREVFARGQRNIEVIGPIPEVEEEAAAVHAGYWN